MMIEARRGGCIREKVAALSCCAVHAQKEANNIYIERNQGFGSHTRYAFVFAHTKKDMGRLLDAVDLD